jgi:hypothetical protein
MGGKIVKIEIKCEFMKAMFNVHSEKKLRQRAFMGKPDWT